MTIKLPQLPQVSSLNPVQPSRTAAIKNAVADAVSSTGSAVDGFVNKSASTVKNAVDTHPLAGTPLDPANLPSKEQIASLFGIGKKPADKLVESTADLRNTVGTVQQLQAKLASMPANDPGRASVQQQLTQAEGRLSSRYGYQNGQLPAPGSLWVDPKFLDSKALPNGQVTASQFPVGTPVSRPPSALDAMFAGGKSYGLTGADGKPVTFHTAAEYQSWLSQNRAAQGMPRTDGEPVGVQMNFEGGGGKGKRYGPALSEMASLGVIPTSVAGTSAGAITAAFVAAGADAQTMQKLASDPELAKMMDIDPTNIHGGLMDGQKAYDWIDQTLRQLTGITDRPVTFADLKIPLQLVATKMSDSNPDPGTGDLTQAKNRLFVMSQETTPNMPVAMAVRASMSIPGAFDPVDAVDPMTGRQLKLVDGGVLDNLPMSESPRFGLPTVGVSLQLPENGQPSKFNDSQPGKLRGGNLDVDNVVLNGLFGKEMFDASKSKIAAQHAALEPSKGQFMLGLPVFDLTDPSKADSTIKFGYDQNVDPSLDAQTRNVTRDFFRQVLGNLTDPSASATNIRTDVGTSFQRTLQMGGKPYLASYSGGDSVHFSAQDGSKAFDVSFGADKIQAMMIDGASYGALDGELIAAAQHKVS